MPMVLLLPSGPLSRVSKTAESISQSRRLLHSLVQRHLDCPIRKARVTRIEAVIGEAGDDVEVNVKHILTTMCFVVLAHRDSVGSTHQLDGPGNPGQGRHQSTRERALDVVDLRDVDDWHDEHVALIAGLLVKARENGCILITIRDDIRRQGA
jgi:hypothetical protein